jgi:hypothetical protein
MTMKIFLALLLATGLGCAAARPQAKPAAPPVAEAKIKVTGAKIIRLNTQFQFVVLDFTSRVMPPVGTKLPVYRGADKVGEVQITEPVRINFATADILSGELQLGDEAR